MERSKLIARLKKLLALSKSNEPHEAALAMKRAQELMAVYNLTHSEIKESEVQEHTSKSYHKGQSLPAYKGALVSTIRKAFQCEVFLQGDYKRSGSWMKIVVHPVFIGLDPNAEIASYVYDFLARKLDKARAEFMKGINKNTKRQNKTARADYFSLGWVSGVHDQIMKMIPPSEVPDIVKSYKAKRTKGFEETENRATHESKKARWQDGMKGYQEGKQVEINKGMGGGQTVKTIEQ